MSKRDASEENYLREFRALRQSAYLDFPLVVGIETLSLCNASCGFCPYSGLSRKGEAMPDWLIEKILNDLQEVAARPPFRFNLSRVNEPFLDTRLLAISLEINRRFPEAGMLFFTNGTVLTEAKLLQMAALRNVEYLNISVNECEPAPYEATMGLPFARTLERLDLTHRMVSSGCFPHVVQLSRVGDGTHADDAFIRWATRRYPMFRAVVNIRGGWMDSISPAAVQVPDVGCTQWFKLHFLSDGRSPFCCMDAEARWGQGDARSHHVIHEIYNHPPRRAIRMEIESRAQLSVCRACPQMV